jgi:hypothetical protein
MNIYVATMEAFKQKENQQKTNVGQSFDSSGKYFASFSK